MRNSSTHSFVENIVIVLVMELAGIFGISLILIYSLYQIIHKPYSNLGEAV